MIPVRLREAFSPGFEVETVEHRGWKGVANGSMLPLAEQAGFECLVTRDRSIPAQQHLAALVIAILLVRPRGQRLRFWEELIPQIEQELSHIRPGEVRRIAAPP